MPIEATGKTDTIWAKIGRRPGAKRTQNLDFEATSRRQLTSKIGRSGGFAAEARGEFYRETDMSRAGCKHFLSCS